jgi:DNA-binding NarL/FixJ family response regulator
MTEGPIHLMLADDHAALREPLAALLDRDPALTVVDQATSLAEARAKIANGQPVDIALVDLDLGDGSGVDLIRDLRHANPNAKVLVLTGTRDERLHAQAIMEGASGIMSKSTSIAELVAALHRLAAGEPLVPLAEVIELVRNYTLAREREMKLTRAIALLTPRELDVLQALGEGLSDRAIGERLHIGVKTVSSHVSSILAKLDAESRLQAVALAHRAGVIRFE